jgi:hypothetical protein
VTMLDMNRLDDYLRSIRAPATLRAYAEGRNCGTTDDLWRVLLEDGNAGYAAWWWCRERDVRDADPLVRRWVVRTLRSHDSATAERYGFGDLAEKLRAVTESIPWEDLCGLAEEACDGSTVCASVTVLAGNYPLAALGASAAALAASGDVSLDARRAERALQVSDLRELCGCPRPSTASSRSIPDRRREDGN